MLSSNISNLRNCWPRLLRSSCRNYCKSEKDELMKLLTPKRKQEVSSTQISDDSFTTKQTTPTDPDKQFVSKQAELTPSFSRSSVQQEARFNNHDDLASSSRWDSQFMSGASKPKQSLQAPQSGYSNSRAVEEGTRHLRDMKLPAKSEADLLKHLFRVFYKQDPPISESASAAASRQSSSAEADELFNVLQGIPVKTSDPEPNFRRIDEVRERTRKPAPPDERVDRQRSALPQLPDVSKKRSYVEPLPVDILNGDRLGIFCLKESSSPLPGRCEEPNELATWNQLEREYTRRLYAKAPRNGFEEMIEWTDQGKLWPYPIDNEFQSEELDVGFHEHVFLEHLLDVFPQTGPIRHFMEVVIHGLSRNPFMTVKMKHDHVAWFKAYFDDMGPQIMKLHELETKYQAAPSASSMFDSELQAKLSA